MTRGGGRQGLEVVGSTDTRCHGSKVVLLQNRRVDKATSTKAKVNGLREPLGYVDQSSLTLYLPALQNEHFPQVAPGSMATACPG